MSPRRCHAEVSFLAFLCSQSRNTCHHNSQCRDCHLHEHILLYACTVNLILNANTIVNASLWILNKFMKLMKTIIRNLQFFDDDE